MDEEKAAAHLSHLAPQHSPPLTPPSAGGPRGVAREGGDRPTGRYNFRRQDFQPFQFSKLRLNPQGPTKISQLQELKKGALIKSYRYSHALITPGFTHTHQTHPHTHLRTSPSSHIPINKCVNLYLGNVKIYLIRILCAASSSRCVLTATIRCVFKTSNVTRFQMDGP